MAPTAQEPQHFDRMVLVAWFPENETGDRHDGVRAHDQRIGMTACALRGFVVERGQGRSRQGPRPGSGGRSTTSAGSTVKGICKTLEQFLSTRRAGREHYDSAVEDRQTFDMIGLRVEVE